MDMMMTARINRDALTNAQPHQVCRGAMTILDTMQNMHKEEQVASAAIVFLALCSRLRLEPQDAFTVSKNMLNGKEGVRPEFVAVERYMKGEL